MKQGFDSPRETWNSRYAQDSYLFGIQPNVFLQSQRHRLVPGMKALAVADGEGRNSVWMARQGLVVTAFDIARVGVDKARKLAAASGVTVDFHNESVENWVWTDASYDVVAAIFIQFAAPDQRQALFEGMLATLKPGGLLILQGYTPRQLGYKTGGPSLVSHLYTAELLKTTFAAQEILELREHDTELFEGSQHHGMSALIDCVVRRR
ncbi:MAG: class I SAM-dependent methyltransferase [Burkholderiaceae bacterium]